MLSGIEWESVKCRQRSISATTTRVRGTVLVPTGCPVYNVNCLNHQPKALAPSKTLTYFVEHRSPAVMPCDHILTVHLY